MEIIIVISLLVIIIILFALEKISVDIITLGSLILLVLSGIITPAEAFEGFSSDFIIILGSIFVISGALSETGLLDKIGSTMIQKMKNKTLFISYTMLVTAFLSAFMNNTTVTALVTGPVVGMSRKLNISPSKVLIPVAYASILGGTCTLIGTSTNVAVSSYIESVGFEPLSFFEIFFVGLILCISGIVFMLIFWNKILPDRAEGNLSEEYHIKQYLSEVSIEEGSELIGKLAFQSKLAQMDIRIIKILREKLEIIPDQFTRLEKQDVLLIECKLNELIKIKEATGIKVTADMKSDHNIESEQVSLMEILVTPESILTKKTLKEIRFRQNYNLVVLGIHRLGGKISEKIGNVRLKTGDVLLVQGKKDSITAFKETNEFSILGDFKVTLFKEKKGIISAVVFLIAIIAASLNIVPLSISFLTAALITIVLGAVTPERAYEIINWKLLILIGGMTAFGTAMHNSGASQFLAESIASLLGGYGIMYVLSGFVILVVLLTQPMSNAAAALVVLPVAIEAAHILNCDPRSFAIAIMLGASVSLITPFEPSCILVYGPGKYKFSDFVKAGLPLTIILLILILIMVPIVWPLQP
ncbi:SLC13 family permease [Gramella sp. AN32]|uniref:SLC13 family permease n=1 Tax=Christiangramia antarctica TaxID=2058158 RepID=A0ABW5X2K0_9FLAO|nr:SLC13 family permease [Gramella sp. AN32]MCM4157761.1 potassium transporter TrkA [Gramella sp. AN32]